eukprot:m.1448131 g.1448131  ORF g.1448131 m.1448131 type:complete len:69 (+) comp25111_c0_seq8:74-280(+)
MLSASSWYFHYRDSGLPMHCSSKVLEKMFFKYCCSVSDSLFKVVSTKRATMYCDDLQSMYTSCLCQGT